MKSPLRMYSSNIVILWTKCLRLVVLITVAASLFVPQSSARPQAESRGAKASSAARPEETEVWEPIPPVVRPGHTDAEPASDAPVLFDGKNLDEWVSSQDKSPAKWIVTDGVMIVNKAVGNIETRRAFKNYQLHIDTRFRPAAALLMPQHRAPWGIS